MLRFIILGFFLLSSCTPSRAWLVSQDEQQAVIGYQLGNHKAAQVDLEEKIRQNAQQVCGEHVRWVKSDPVDRVEVDSDTFNTNIADSTSYADQKLDFSSDTWGADYAAHFVSVHEHHSYTFENKWQEVTIKCLESH